MCCQTPQASAGVRSTRIDPCCLALDACSRSRGSAVRAMQRSISTKGCPIRTPVTPSFATPRHGLVEARGASWPVSPQNAPCTSSIPPLAPYATAQLSPSPPYNSVLVYEDPFDTLHCTFHVCALRPHLWRDHPFHCAKSMPLRSHFRSCSTNPGLGEMISRTAYTWRWGRRGMAGECANL